MKENINKDDKSIKEPCKKVACLFQIPSNKRDVHLVMDGDEDLQRISL